MFKSVYLVCLVVCVVNNDAARILGVFPTPSISHQVAFRPLMHELARRGHEVVVVTTDPAFPKGQTPDNLTEINVKEMSYDMWKKSFLAMSSNLDLFSQMKVGLTSIADIFMKQIQEPEVQKVLYDKSKKFDLLFIEAMIRPTLALSHITKSPIIQISSFGASFENYEIMGAPVHPILYPAIYRQHIVNLTFSEKVSELYHDWIYTDWHSTKEADEDKIIKSVFGDDFPDLSELKNNVDMLFLNMHPMWEGNRPVPPNVIYMGGVHQNPVKELPEDLKSYLDAAKNGVVYVSFGTNLNPSQLPPEKIQAMVKVFSKLPYNVLWKWDKDVLPGRTENIKIFKWLPQSDLLRHPNIKLFITQGGLQSTDEAITAGVPLLGIPMLGDQWFNVEKYREHKIGLRVDIETLTEEILMKSIKTVIEDQSFRDNVASLRVKMRDQPQSPLDRAVWWTEYVLRHKGAKHLRSPAANITWAQYLELELVATLLLIALGIALAVSLVIYYSFKCYKSHFSIKKKVS